jgi:hypothetical protein
MAAFAGEIGSGYGVLVRSIVASRAVALCWMAKDPLGSDGVTLGAVFSDWLMNGFMAIRAACGLHVVTGCACGRQVSL